MIEIIHLKSINKINNILCHICNIKIKNFVALFPFNSNNDPNGALSVLSFVFFKKF